MSVRQLNTSSVRKWNFSVTVKIENRINALVGGQIVFVKVTLNLWKHCHWLQQGLNWVANIAREEMRITLQIFLVMVEVVCLCNKILIFSLVFFACFWWLFLGILEYLDMAYSTSHVAFLAVMKAMGLAGYSHSWKCYVRWAKKEKWKQWYCREWGDFLIRSKYVLKTKHILRFKDICFIGVLYCGAEMDTQCVFSTSAFVV